MRRLRQSVDFALACTQKCADAAAMAATDINRRRAMKRRKFLKARRGVAATGMAGILASHRAPVFAQANTVHMLRWNDFVPAADKVLREVVLRPRCRRRSASSSTSRRSTPTTCRRAPPRRSSPAAGPTSSCCSTTTRSSTRRAAVDVSDVAERSRQGAGRYLQAGPRATEPRSAASGCRCRGPW